jgi:hypothetical protein
MSRGCLSETALERVAAELGTDAERAHVATCMTCASRRRRLSAELAQITLTLAIAPLPAVDHRRTARRWAAIATAAAIAAGTILGVEVAAWRVVQRMPDAAQAEQMAALSDLSTSLFSIQPDDDDETTDEDDLAAGGES